MLKSLEVAVGTPSLENLFELFDSLIEGFFMVS